MPGSPQPDGPALRGQHAAGVTRVEPDPRGHAHGVADEIDAEPVASAIRPTDTADDDVRLLLDEPRPWIRRAADVRRVVGRVAGDVRLDCVPCKLLGLVLGSAAGNREHSEDDERRRGNTQDRGPRRTDGETDYDWRSSRTRDFLPTRPRR